MSNPENPPAFPNVEPRDPQFSSAQPGMTLRDWFAGQAIGAIITSMASGDYKSPPEGMTGAQMLARDAYYTADAMLAARDQKA